MEGDFPIRNFSEGNRRRIGLQKERGDMLRRDLEAPERSRFGHLVTLFGC